MWIYKFQNNLFQTESRTIITSFSVKDHDLLLNLANETSNWKLKSEDKNLWFLIDITKG